MACAPFVTHLECSATGARYAADELHGLSSAGKPPLVRYDLDAIRRAVTRETFARREGSFWKYREFLPVQKNADVVSLGEVARTEGLLLCPEGAAAYAASRAALTDGRVGPHENVLLFNCASGLKYPLWRRQLGQRAAHPAPRITV